MSNFSIKLNLSLLTGAFVTDLKGKYSTKRCLCIPIDEANLFQGQKGCYVDLTAIEVQNSQYGDTHCVKQNLPSDVYSKMTEGERRAMPILGNVKPFKKPEIPVDPANEVTVEEKNDLPF
jgi:hypothetical protein